jgi:hypothetical protein
MLSITNPILIAAPCASSLAAYKFMSLRTMCPALIFAASRNDSVRGRTVTLIVSINTRNGFNHRGAPSGRKCAVNDFMLNVILDRIRLIHMGSPNDKVNNK